MSFTSLNFILFGILAVLLLRFLPPGKIRDGILLIINVLFLFTFVSAPAQMIPLVCFLALGYGAVCAAARKVRISAIVIATVLLFIWLKHYDLIAFLPAPGFNYTTIGLSYILFRIIHLTVDVGQGAQKVPSPVSYINYTLFFLNLMSGPIQRFDDFCASYRVKAPALTPEVTERALSRILLGYVMVALVSTVCSNLLHMIEPKYYAALATGALPHTVPYFMACCAAYFGFMYANFSGYMHIVIGVGALAGFRLPENFNYPMKSKNVIDFWSRWHITLSDWFKFYLFNPLVMALTKRWPGKQMRLTIGSFAFFVTFFVMGMWHGSTIIYLVYGIWLGGLLSINYYWQKTYPKKYGKAAYKKLCENVWYRKFAWSAAMSYIMVGMTCIWLAPTHAADMLSVRGVATWFGGYFGFILLGTLCGGLWEMLTRPVFVRLAAPAAQAMRHPGATLAGVFALVIAGTLIVGMTLSYLGHFQNGMSAAALLVMSSHLTFFVLLAAIVLGLFDPLVLAASGQIARPGLKALAGGSWMGLKIFLVACIVILMSARVPEFIYQGF